MMDHMEARDLIPLLPQYKEELEKQEKGIFRQTQGHCH